jgi:hypothetical protein
MNQKTQVIIALGLVFITGGSSLLNRRKNDNTPPPPDPTQASNFEYGSKEHQQWIEEQKVERIEHQLSPLRDVLNEDQLARYREHLEVELP